MPSLPLFPLGATLMPGMPLPLQVFEPRYVALLRHLVDSAGAESGFGVVAIRRGFEVGDRTNELYAVGCLAVLDRIVQVADGLFLLLAHGAERFRLDGIDDDAGTPWITGSVTWLDEPVGDDSRLPVLTAQVQQVLRTWADAHGIGLPEAPDEPNRLAYWAAECADLDQGDRQRLLESDSTSARLSFVLRTIRRESALSAQLGVTGGRGAAPPSLN